MKFDLQALPGETTAYDKKERAVFEILVNAIVHRDYMQSGSEVHLDIYDDRIEIVSPGGMYDGSRIQECDLKNIPSVRRNPLLADVFSRLNLMERKGSGFEKVFSAYHKQINFNHAMTPRFSSDLSWFKAVLPNLNYDSTGKSSGKSLGKSSEKIVELICQNPHITIPEMSDRIGISTRAVEKQLAKLQKAGLIKRNGSHKSGSWVKID